jgi:SWI/SNF-related matrix-associated actin-dependent regulator 1 of chromatin subfamily A
MSLPSKFRKDKTPYQYQVEGANFALSNFYTLNMDEPGLGKTIQALLAACMLLEKHPGKKVLVLCPQYLTRNWHNEIEDWTNGIRVSTFDPKCSDAMWDSDVVLASYYHVRKYPDLISEDAYDFVIVDEAHNFKNPKAKQTLGLLKVVSKLKPNFLLLLTGTPIKNRVPDIYIPLYLMAMSKRTENPITKKYRSYYLFCYNFCTVRKTPFGTQFTGEKNVEELRTYLKGRRIGRKKKDVVELPEVVEKQVVVDYKEIPELLREYEAFNGVVESAESSAKAESARLKAKFTSEYVRELLDKEVGPIVIFTDHLGPVEVIREELKDFKVAVIVGGVSVKKREKIKTDFQAGYYDVLIATIGAFSTGVTLTRSSNLVFNDISWVPSDLQQAKDRIHRLGQTATCFVHYIVGAVVDKKILRSIQAKLRTIKKVLG